MPSAPTGMFIFCVGYFPRPGVAYMQREEHYAPLCNDTSAFCGMHNAMSQSIFLKYPIGRIANSFQIFFKIKLLHPSEALWKVVD